MKNTEIALVVVLLPIVAACTNLTSVSNFAAESSEITAHTAILDNSNIISISKQFKLNGSLNTLRFADDQKVVTQAEIVLTNYMSVLAKLTDGKLATVDSSVGSVQASLKTLGDLNTTAQTASASAQTLADWLIKNVATAKAAAMIQENDENVQILATFLAAWSQTISNDYSILDTGMQTSYSNIELDPTNSRICPIPRQCQDINTLIELRKTDDSNTLAAKSAAAAAAGSAFTKIAADHRELAQHTNSLAAADVKAYLLANEPALLNAIAAVKKL